MATTYAVPAHTTYHTLQAQQLVTAAQRLAGLWASGQLTASQAHQRATSYMHQANNLMVAAYAAGRGYAATQRIAGYAYAVSNEIATEAGSTYYMAVRGGTAANPKGL